MDIIKATEILGVAYDANAATIKDRYRTLAMRFHPDRGGSVQKMQLVNEAYKYLSSRDVNTRLFEWSCSVDFSRMNNRTTGDSNLDRKIEEYARFRAEEELRASRAKAQERENLRAQADAAFEAHMREIREVQRKRNLLPIGICTLPYPWAFFFIGLLYSLRYLWSLPVTNVIFFFVPTFLTLCVFALLGFGLVMLSKQVLTKGWSSVLGGIVKAFEKDYLKEDGFSRMNGFKNFITGSTLLMLDLIALPFYLAGLVIKSILRPWTKPRRPMKSKEL